MTLTHCTVLVVDDSPEDRELYRRFLLKDKACYYTLLEAATGREGLALWQRHRPDVVLLDYRLPDCDGLEFLSQISYPSSCPGVAESGHEFSAESRAECGSQQKIQTFNQQRSRPCLPVVMLTGLGTEAIAVKAIKAGAQDYLVKGQIMPEGLHLAIQGAIETVRLQTQLQQRIERERVVSQITRQIHRSLNLKEILQTTVHEVRQFLQTDRVVIFRLQSDGQGTVVTESVGAAWTPLLSTSFSDPCFNESYVEPFRQGLVTVKPDIYDGSIHPCHVELLSNLQVRANLVVPILQDNRLWGMLIAHHCAAPRPWEPLEIDLLQDLATQVGIALQQAELYQQARGELIERQRVEQSLRQQTERERLVTQIAQRVRQTLNLNEILQTTIDEVRQFLHTDRVFMYRFNPDLNGTVVVESVGDRGLPILNARVEDQYFLETQGEDYRQGRVQSIADIETAGLTPCHVEWLQRFQVRAHLAVPILRNDQLWGLLVANHCAEPRPWQPFEIDLLQQLSIQVGIALQQSELYQQAQNELAERKQTEELLRKSEGFKQRVLDSSADCVKILDLEGRLLYMNSNGLCLMEIDDFTPFLNAEWVSFWQDEARRQAESALTSARVGQVSTFQGFCVTAKGTPKWWEVIVCPVLDGEGQVERILSISRDVSDRHRLEQERDRLLEQEKAARIEAERANRIKDEFLAVLSHELRSPLNPILGWTRLMQSRNFNPARSAEALATIERNAKLQIQLIDDLLDTARILRGKLSLNLTAVDLVFVIRAAIDTVKATATAKNIRLQPVLPPVGQVAGDAARLQQIVWNLLSNAVKFTPANGRVDIELSQVETSAQIFAAQITVRDTGKGIDPEFLPYLFESFRQEDASTTRNYGGLGLGLAIARHLVEAHGGTISAESPGPGQGATFTVCLPLLPTESLPVSADPPPAPELNLSGIRVLAIDDEPDARELLVAMLSHHQAEVLTVASAAEVLSALPTFQPHVLVSDIGMPQVDGYSLIQQVRSLPHHQGSQVPAIALTAYARQEDRERALSAGFQHHIAKPIDPDQLVQAIAQLSQRSEGASN